VTGWGGKFNRPGISRGGKLKGEYPMRQGGVEVDGRGRQKTKTKIEKEGGVVMKRQGRLPGKKST